MVMTFLSHCGRDRHRRDDKRRGGDPTNPISSNHDSLLEIYLNRPQPRTG